MISSMSQRETEHERKVREYWARAYDTIINNKDSNNRSLPYEPTAVLTSNPNPKDKRIRLENCSTSFSNSNLEGSRHIQIYK